MLYHPGKVNIMTYALSKKTQIGTTMLSTWVLAEEFANWHRWPVGWNLVCNATMGSKLIKNIWATQRAYSRYEQYVEMFFMGTIDNPLSMVDFGHVRYQSCKWLHEDEFLKTTILSKLHNL